MRLDLAWANFCAEVNTCDSEAELEQAIDSVIKSGGSVYRALRLHSRLNKLRAHREREELAKEIKRAKSSTRSNHG